MNANLEREVKAIHNARLTMTMDVHEAGDLLDILDASSHEGAEHLKLILLRHRPRAKARLDAMEQRYAH